VPKVIWERAASGRAVRAVGGAALRRSVRWWICKLPVGGDSGCQPTTGSVILLRASEFW